MALLAPKGKSNREHKRYLTSRAIVRLLDQFAPRRPRSCPAGRKALPTGGQLRQTKPIGRGVAGVKCQVNKDQRQVLRAFPLQTSPLGLPTYETKPIPTRAKQRASALRKKSYDECGIQTASTKQSQLSRGQQWARAGKTAGAAGEPQRANKACAKQSWCNPAGIQSCPVKGSRPAGMNVGVSGDNE